MRPEAADGPEAGPSCRAPPTGLVNLGNTCYFNSSLQLLAACEAVSQELASQGNSLGKGPLGFAFQQALFHLNSAGPMKQQAHHKRRNTYDPQALLAALCRVAPSFSGNQQHDAHEALHALLEGLQDEETKLQALLSRAPSLGGRQSGESPSPCPSRSTLIALAGGGSPSKAFADRRLSSASAGGSSNNRGLQSPAQSAGGSQSQLPSGSLPKPGLLSQSVPGSQGGAVAGGGAAQQAAPAPAPLGPVGSLFKGQLRSTVTCNTCQHTSVTTESFLELPLPIPTPQQLQQLRAARSQPDTPVSSAASQLTSLYPEADTADSKASQRVAGVTKGVRGKKGRASKAQAKDTEEGETQGDKQDTPQSSANTTTAKARDTTVKVAPKISQKELRRRKAEEKRQGIAAKRQARKAQTKDGSGSSSDDNESVTHDSDASETVVTEPRLLGGMPVTPLCESPTTTTSSHGAGDVSVAGSDKHELHSEPSTVITGFHVLPRTSTNGSTISPSSSNADTGSHHSPMAEGGLSHYLKHPKADADDAASAPPPEAPAPPRGAAGAAARRAAAAASKAPPNVSECMELFFAPETVVWECAGEKRALRALSASPVNSLTQPVGSLQGPLGSLTLSPATASPQLTSALAAVAALHAGKPLPSPSPPAAGPALTGSPRAAAGAEQPAASPGTGLAMPVLPVSGSVPLSGTVGSLDLSESPLGSLLSSLPLPTSVLVPKKVRFSPLPPSVHYIPGSREQRGTDVEAALRGEVPFVRPACAPLPERIPTASELRAAARAAAKGKGKGKGKGRGQAPTTDATTPPTQSESDTRATTQPRKGKKSKGATCTGPEQFLKTSTTDNHPDTAPDAKNDEPSTSKKGGKGSKGGKKGDKGDPGSPGLSKSERKAKKRDAQRSAALKARSGDTASAGSDACSGDSDAEAPQAPHAAADPAGPAVGMGTVDDDGGVGDVASGGECEEDVWLAEAARERARGPPLARGLLIHAQIDPVDRNNLSVRLVAGVSSDPKEVAAVMPPRHRSSRRGAPLCRANISAAWERERLTSAIPTLSPVPTPPLPPLPPSAVDDGTLHPSHTSDPALTQTISTLTPHHTSRDGDWDHEPDLDESSDPEDLNLNDATDGVGGAHRPAEAEALLGHTGAVEADEGAEEEGAAGNGGGKDGGWDDVGEGGGERGGGEGSESGGEDDPHKEAMCDVCDAVQVIMDCAAHMVLTQGVGPAFHSLGLGAPLRVYHDFGGWRVAGTHADTKQRWVYPDDFANDIHDPTTIAATQTDKTATTDSARRLQGFELGGTEVGLGVFGVMNGGDKEVGDAPRLLGGHQEMASPRRSESPRPPASPPIGASAGVAGDDATSAECSDEAPTCIDARADTSSGTIDANKPMSSPQSSGMGDTQEGIDTGTHSSAQGVPCVRRAGIGISGPGVSVSPLPSPSPSPLTGSSPRPGNTGRLKRPENSLFQRPAVKCFSIQTAPRLLLVHLKRFTMTSLSRGSLRGGWVKVDTHIVFPRTLNIGPFMAHGTTGSQGAARLSGSGSVTENPTPFAVQAPAVAGPPPADAVGAVAQEAGAGTEYRLTALIEHQGTMRSGHYVTYVRHAPVPHTHTTDTPTDISQHEADDHAPAPRGKKGSGKGKKGGVGSAECEGGVTSKVAHTDRWYLVNDETVREVPESKVFAAQAYALLYERMD